MRLSDEIKLLIINKLNITTSQLDCLKDAVCLCLLQIPLFSIIWNVVDAWHRPI